MKKELSLEIIKAITFYVLIPFCLGYCIGEVVKQRQAKDAAVAVEEQVSEYTSKFVNLILEMDKKQTADSSSTDHLINTYLLKSYDLYEDVFSFTVEENLLDKNPGQFQEALKLMNSISEWQLKQDQRRQNVLTGTGFSVIYLLETEQYKTLVEEFTIKTCQDVLKIDPDNKQALETINKINSEKK